MSVYDAGQLPFFPSQPQKIYHWWRDKYWVRVTNATYPVLVPGKKGRNMVGRKIKLQKDLSAIKLLEVAEFLRNEQRGDSGRQNIRKSTSF